MTTETMNPAASQRIAALRSGAEYTGTVVRHLAGNPSSLFGLVVITVLVILAVFAPLLATHDPYAQDLAATLQAPSGAHFFGTDEVGRDVYSRIVYGSRITLSIIALVAVIVGPIGLAVGTLAGVIHALITLRFNIPSFITTLGAMLLWKGATLLYHGASSLRFKPSEPFNTIFNGSIGVVHASIIWFAIFAVIFYFLLHHHRIGNHFFAVGGNQKAAIAIGINPARTKIIAFAIAGFMAALSGIIAGARVSSIQPGGGLGLELVAIAACVIGGHALMGGRGAILGIVLGTCLMYTIQDVLLLLRAPGFYFEMFVGALIVIAVIMNMAIRRKN